METSQSGPLAGTGWSDRSPDHAEGGARLFELGALPELDPCLLGDRAVKTVDVLPGAVNRSRR